MLTVESINANSVRVSAESANDDPVDFVTVAGDEMPALSSSTEGGVVSAVLTWQGGKPATKDFNVLWSKASTEGNWQLNEFGAETFDVRAVCPGSSTGGNTGG
jgi:hypothetical protein